MAEPTLSPLAMRTEFFASEHIEAAARQTGVVKRASKIPGKIFLTLVTFGSWSDATPTFAPLAAKVTPCVEPLEVSPEAIYHRMHKRAHAFLQEMIQPAFATLHAGTHGCDDGRVASCAKGHSADSTGFDLPASWKDSFPGSGGSAATAGAKIQAVWDSQSSTFAHVALTPWNIPEQKYRDQVVALAPKDVVFICALGYCKIQALARLVAADAYFLRRRNHHTPRVEAVEGGVPQGALATFLPPVTGKLIEHPILLGAPDLGAARLLASRVPEPIVHARRRKARKQAKKTGYTPSPAPLELLAWKLLMTHVPATSWPTDTLLNAYPRRWPIERMLQSWKSYLPLASSKTNTEDTP